jgi:hypothetical protein
VGGTRKRKNGKPSIKVDFIVSSECVKRVQQQNVERRNGRTNQVCLFTSNVTTTLKRMLVCVAPFFSNIMA